MKKLEKTAATILTFLVFISGSTDIIRGSEINTVSYESQGRAYNANKTEYEGEANIQFREESDISKKLFDSSGVEAETLSSMLSCVIGAMLERQCFVLEGEPDLKLASLSVYKAISWGILPELCEYADEAVAVISQSGMRKLCSGMFAFEELTALDTETAEENVYILGDKIVIFISDERDIAVELGAAEMGKDGSVTVLCKVSSRGEYICSAEAVLIEKDGWQAGYSIGSLAISYQK